MPQQPSPPYDSTAVIIPRQLNRWLDINAQNGQLQRTKTYITLPTFSESITWNGVSDIIVTFNYEGPNNFSLTSIAQGLPAEVNYLLCIMWIDKNECVHRYAIWNNVGEVMYIPCPLYTGQFIGKNFRFEVWSVANQAEVSQDTPITFYTSKLGIQDYRHGIDVPLVIADAPCTNFRVTATDILALPSDIGLLFQVDPFHNLVPAGGNFVSWTSMVDNTTQLILSGANTVVIPSSLPVGGNCVNLQNDSNYLYTASAPKWGVMGLVLTFNVTGATASYLFSAYPSGLTLYWNNGTVTSGGSGPSVVGLAQNTWYTALYYLAGSNATLSVYNTQTGVLVSTNTSLAPILGYTNAIGLGNANCEIVEALMISNTPSNLDVAQIVAYMQNKYFTTETFELPFVWPINSTPKINNI